MFRPLTGLPTYKSFYRRDPKLVALSALLNECPGSVADKLRAAGYVTLEHLYQARETTLSAILNEYEFYSLRRAIAKHAPPKKGQ
jgi:hypothetical protein